LIESAATPEHDTVALYFVATPFHYLCARSVARHFDMQARRVLLWYRPHVEAVVRKNEWDAAAYVPWPRFEPLPGPFGRHRRLLSNLREVGALAGSCSRLLIHSPVFDTEAINYFLHGLPRLCGAREVHGRILPDGLGSLVRQPLSPARRAAQALRSLRRWAAPQLHYWRYAGDRTGADAEFCDRVYVLPGFAHPYPQHKAVVLPALAQASGSNDASHAPGRVLIVGQPLQGVGLLDAAGAAAVDHALRDWIAAQGFTEVLYKAHPRDPRHELKHADDALLLIDEPLESWMAREPCAAVVGVNSTALLMARQLYGTATQVLGFGWDQVRWRSDAARADALSAFSAAGVSLVSCSTDG
jgi:Alpha-2,8-polysialyltransferase (POLYST)